MDGDGLILRVTRNGSRSWILRTLVQGKRRDIGLGGSPTISLKEARDAAFTLRKIARAGGDPISARDKDKSPAPTFKEAAEIAHKLNTPSWKNAKHADQWINTLKAYVFPVLGESRVDTIRSEHITRALNPIWLNKPETARRVLQRIRTVLLWAKGNGHRAESPTDEVAAARKALPKQNDRPKHHTALPYTGVPAFILGLRAFNVSEPIKLALEFLVLTATRTNEVLEAKWSEIDFENEIWTIPASRMKAKREHQVPLSDRCVEILEEAHALSEKPNGYVFPGTMSAKPLSNMAFLKTLERMTVEVTAHGFRSSFRVWCAEQTRFPREVAEAALAHVIKDATEAAYLRSTFFERRRDLMTEWANFVTGYQSDPTVTNDSREGTLHPSKQRHISYGGGRDFA
jgi:integrase